MQHFPFDAFTPRVPLSQEQSRTRARFDSARETIPFRPAAFPMQRASVFRNMLDLARGLQLQGICGNYGGAPDQRAPE